MSDFTAAFAVTIPANTPNPMLFNHSLGLCVVESVLVVVPAGCAGNVGFQIWEGGTTSYPLQNSGFFVFDDYPFVQEISNGINSGSWAINAYNNDVFQHVLQVYYKANYVQYAPSPSLSPVIAV
jgi:hypothetical protein